MGWWYGDVGSRMDGAWAEIHKHYQSPPTDPHGYERHYYEKLDLQSIETSLKIVKYIDPNFELDYILDTLRYLATYTPKNYGFLITFSLINDHVGILHVLKLAVLQITFCLAHFRFRLLRIRNLRHSSDQFGPGTSDSGLSIILCDKFNCETSYLDSCLDIE